MRVVRVPEGAGGWRVGAVLDDGLRLYPRGTSVLAALGAVVPEGAEPSPPGEYLAPLAGAVSLRDCVGFLDHVRNARRARGVREPLPPAWAARPAFYFANPRSLLAATAPVALPPGTAAFDLELEVGAVIGRPGRDLTPEQAAGRIAGYVLYCDWSARDVQSEERTMQIGQGKGKDCAVSLGPWILTADEAAGLRRRDGLDIEVSVHINDEPLVRTRFLGMDWSFEELVAYASVGADVLPGDVVASGTVPGGCLMEHSAEPDFRGWLRAGDRVRLDAGPLGLIETTIAPPPPVVSWREAATTRATTITD
ncbi:fumarylacetoacetate hydrolase family protein [Phytohabitans sp. ZYX-F-186]|uniref:Fumarylacetoacetate hydrolase family protein n=1 Tax=Phytohabitans maris TaxID=3071409 RepID=A0ABU0ZGZ9_9ACTN|nr:fumarylacetoacetate hydrolase family protein [Phytohabitans sp. ZYX-F-186]MDQ7905751.1 fumarylacetoacetate hydrolase family protein [Phytohabitans sp. ZYX-F-186]